MAVGIAAGVVHGDSALVDAGSHAIRVTGRRDGTVIRGLEVHPALVVSLSAR